MVGMPDLFGTQKQYSNGEKHQWDRFVVVFSITMLQRKNANQKCQPNHAIFKNAVFDNIKTKNWQAGHQ